MTREEAEKEPYYIRIDDQSDTSGCIRFYLTQKGGLQHARGPNGPAQRVPQYKVAVRHLAEGLTFDWSESQDDPGQSRARMETEVVTRMNDRSAWIERVTALVNQVKLWAEELGWNTKVIPKKLDDSWIGKHQVPGLVMQEEFCRVMLEPQGRSSSGSDGVVDLYQMPAYDDIARLVHEGNQWNILLDSPGSKPNSWDRDAGAVPLSKETLEKVLAELRHHAA